MQQPEGRGGRQGVAVRAWALGTGAVRPSGQSRLPAAGVPFQGTAHLVHTPWSSHIIFLLWVLRLSLRSLTTGSFLVLGGPVAARRTSCLRHALWGPAPLPPPLPRSLPIRPPSPPAPPFPAAAPDACAQGPAGRPQHHAGDPRGGGRRRGVYLGGGHGAHVPAVRERGRRRNQGEEERGAPWQAVARVCQR